MWLMAAFETSCAAGSPLRMKTRFRRYWWRSAPFHQQLVRHIERTLEMREIMVREHMFSPLARAGSSNAPCSSDLPLIAPCLDNFLCQANRIREDHLVAPRHLYQPV